MQTVESLATDRHPVADRSAIRAVQRQRATDAQFLAGAALAVERQHVPKLVVRVQRVKQPSEAAHDDVHQSIPLTVWPHEPDVVKALVGKQLDERRALRLQISVRDVVLAVHEEVVQQLVLLQAVGHVLAHDQLQPLCLVPANPRKLWPAVLDPQQPVLVAVVLPVAQQPRENVVDVLRGLGGASVSSSLSRSMRRRRVGDGLPLSASLRAFGSLRVPSVSSPPPMPPGRDVCSAMERSFSSPLSELLLLLLLLSSEPLPGLCETGSLRPHAAGHHAGRQQAHIHTSMAMACSC
eukprot:COSAG01_NODE_1427_length_10336_cov_12.761207_8_plen_294_part_00